MNESNNAISTFNHLTSLLLRLPAELRNKIYTYFFAGHSILICFITTFWSRPSDPCPLYLVHTQRRVSHMHYPRHLLALTNTCRQTYVETQLLPFAHSTFIGYSEALLAAFPGRIRHLFLNVVKIVQLPMQGTDLFEEKHTRVLKLAWTVGNVLTVLGRLGGLKVLKVVWEGEVPRGYPWEAFRGMLVVWVAGGIQRADIDIEVVVAVAVA